MMRHNNSRGPMMAPEIQELELELQLLKRKRMLLQQQQDMLIGSTNRERQRDYNFNPSSQYNQQQTQDFNYSQLYDDRVSGSSNRDRQFGQKRRAPEPWEGSALAKRFQAAKAKQRNASGPRSNQGFGSNRRGYTDFRQRSDGQRPQPLRNVDARPQPLRNVDARPNNGAKQGSSVQNKGFQRDFRPSKVTKTRSRNPPNRLDSYPQAERKKLVGDTLKTINNNPSVLSSDGPPTPTQSGRLELALGNILKDIRQDFGSNENYVEIFQTDSLLKVVKQTLRDRIRSAMIGLPVNNMKVIIEKYREKFPRETDQEIIDSAMEIATLTRRDSKLAIRLVESDVPEVYFKRNFGRLLDVKLKEMFTKLEEVYAAEKDEDIQSIIDAHTPTASSEAVDKDTNDATEACQTNQNETENVVDKTDGTDGDKIDTSSDVINLTNDDPGTEVNEAAAVVSEDSAPANENKDSVNETDKNDTNTEKEENTENLNETKEETEELSEADAKFLQAWKTYNKKYFNSEFYEKIMSQYLKYKLPRLIPTYKENIIKILDMDKQFRTTKATIIQRVGTKLGKQNNADPKPTQKKQESRLPINHYVKILGRPGLPKRRLMSKFLDDFKPLTIKKHKSLNNLLFVGFHDKEDFDKILAANGTIIGSATLTIAVSEWKNPKDKANTTEDNAEVTTDPEVDKSIINDDLDNQITDLLTSIDAEDTAKNEGESSVKKEGESSEKKDGESSEKKDGESSEKKEGESSEKKDDEEILSTINEEKDEPKLDKPNENDAKEKNETSVSEKNVANDQVDAAKTDTKKVATATPTRASTRLASGTPSGITTRRTSKLS